ncbi:MAG TPA: hypothetical protein VJ777_12720 [Mycobacterium sp.]|nr:hypothetical protein [Mycobacterium sp.]
MGLRLLRSRSGPLTRNAEPNRPGAQLPFPLVELHLTNVGSPIPGVSGRIPLISDLISPVSNKIALVSGPAAFFVARRSRHQTAPN